MRGFRSKELAGIAKSAKRAGWSVFVDGDGHCRIVPPNGGPGVSLSMTAIGSHRSYLNSRAAARRLGLPV